MQNLLSLMLVLMMLLPAAPALAANEPCHVTLVGTRILDNGDGDGFADTDETLRIAVTLEPLCY